MTLTELIDKFIQPVEVDGELHWNWTDNAPEKFIIDGKRVGRGTHLMRLSGQPVPEGKQPQRHCSRPGCCLPAHQSLRKRSLSESKRPLKKHPDWDIPGDVKRLLYARW